MSKKSKPKEDRIEDNRFYKIIFDKNLTHNEKRDAVAQESGKALNEYAAFKDYLIEERKRMAQELIDITSKNSSTELKRMAQEMSGIANKNGSPEMDAFNEASAAEPEPPKPAPEPFEMSEELRKAMAITRHAATEKQPAQTRPSTKPNA